MWEAGILPLLRRPMGVKDGWMDAKKVWRRAVSKVARMSFDSLVCEPRDGEA